MLKNLKYMLSWAYRYYSVQFEMTASRINFNTTAAEKGKHGLQD